MAITQVAEQVGRVIGGRYRLVALAGAGSSASVYRAEDSRLSRTVAVKMLHGTLASDATFLKRFRAEANAAAALNHPNIVKVFDWGDDEAGPYLVMEYLGGGSLAAMIEASARLSPAQATQVGLQAASALEYAHRRGLVHRDVKPANILFDEEGRAAIADFGLARAFAEAAWTEPVGTLFGTARYTSPEQAQGLPAEGRSDVYSLAISLYEAITGEIPFHADSTVSLVMARVGTRVEPPEEAGVLSVVIEGAMAPEAGERIDATRMVEELRAVAAHLPEAAELPLVGTESGLAGRAVDGTAMVGAVDWSTDQGSSAGALPPARRKASKGSSGLTRSPRQLRRRRRLRLLLAVAVVVCILGGGAAAAVESKIFFPKRTVPSLVGATPASASAILKRGGLNLHVVSHRYSKTVAQGMIASQDPARGSRIAQGDAVDVVVSEGPPFVLVPAGLSGLSEATAAAKLGSVGLKPDPRKVYSQSVASGEVVSSTPQGKVRWGATIVLEISQGPQPVSLPSNLAGEDPATASQQLTALGLKVSEQQEHSSTVAKGQVAGSQPSPGQTVHVGDTVILFVSEGPVMVKVPDVSGLSVAEAASKLQAAGLQPQNVYGPPGGNAYTTDPPPGRSVPQGSAVAIYTSPRG